MTKLKMHSKDLTQDNIEKIKALFPNCVTEAQDADGQLHLAVDFDLLRQELASDLVEGPQERYRLDWPGKREAMLLANSPIAKTLRPARGESVEFDSTENLFIEGDNLEALKLLQENYLGKVKMIYIDPPYNTGNDFVYNDDFAESSEEYFERSIQKDEEGNRLVANTESNGRYHSDWLSMMLPRLKLARNLLRDDGVMFISIDDNEQANLKRLCDEVFGSSNFIANHIYAGNSSKNNARNMSITHEYNLIYAKNLSLLKLNKVNKKYSDEFEKRARTIFSLNIDDAEKTKQLRELTKNPRFYDFDHYTYVDKNGVFRANDLTAMNSKNYFDICHPITGLPCKLSTRGWAYTEDRINELINNDMIYFGSDHNSVPQLKCYLFESLSQVPRSIGFYDAQIDTKQLKKDKLFFDFVKPSAMILEFCEMASMSDAIILDFFAGSSTTAHAVMQLNAEDGGNRKFIMVQLPEAVDEKHEAYKAGYKTIAEISKERIRRAGKQILEGECHENWNKDVGFRVLKVDSSNMKDVYYRPAELGQQELTDMVSPIKEDRSSEDLLFQVMLDLGLELHLPITSTTVQGKEVFFVDDNLLVACFASDICEELVLELTEHKPVRMVFADCCFGNNDSLKTNAKQIFKQRSPDTSVMGLF